MYEYVRITLEQIIRVDLIGTNYELLIYTI